MRLSALFNSSGIPQHERSARLCSSGAGSGETRGEGPSSASACLAWRLKLHRPHLVRLGYSQRSPSVTARQVGFLQRLGVPEAAPGRYASRPSGVPFICYI